MSVERIEVDLLTTPADELRPVDYGRRWWFPRKSGNKPTSPSTMYRWIKKGVMGVKLKVLFTADGAVTSEAACREFLVAVDRARRDEMDTTVDATTEQLRAAGLVGGAK